MKYFIKFKQAIQLLVICLIVLWTTSCAVIKPLGVTHEMYQGYIPIEPTTVKYVEVYDDSIKGFITKPWDAISQKDKRKLLPNQSAQVSMRKISVSGELSYMPAAISADIGSYEVIMDYMKYRIEDAIVDSIWLGTGRIGIGLRIKASVVTTKENLNLSGLMGLGAEVSNSNLSGYLAVDIIGVDSKDITNYLPLTSKLDETSIQNALQAIATIKSKIWDEGIHITPHLIAINQKEMDSELVIKERISNVGTFAYTLNSEKIRNFWNPNGEVNRHNETKLKEWMRANMDVLISIPSFIFDEKFEMLKRKAVKDLKL